MLTSHYDWSVQRHGGARTHKWRFLYQGPHEDEARMVYKRHADNLRQGTVKINGPDGKWEQTQAPRLRARW